MGNGLFVLVLYEVDDLLEFVQIHLLVLDKVQDKAGVGLAVVFVHDVTYGDAVIVSFTDGWFVEEGVGDGPALQESLFLKESHLLGDSGIAGFRLRERVYQFPDSQFALLPEDIHYLLFLGREFLFHIRF